MRCDVFVSAFNIFAYRLRHNNEWRLQMISSLSAQLLAIPEDVTTEKRDVLYQFYDSFQTSEELLEKYRASLRESPH